jgi:hypothetical protein
MKCPFDKGLGGCWRLGFEIISFFTRCVISHRHPDFGPDSGPSAWHPVQMRSFWGFHTDFTGESSHVCLGALPWFPQLILRPIGCIYFWLMAGIMVVALGG